MSGGDLSVIVPVRDCAEYLGAAIRSVLERAAGLLEIVVVDDGSTDGSGDVAAAFGAPVRVVRQPPRGVAAARNAGVDAARGELVGFLDADDVWAAETPDPRRVALDAHPEAIAAGGQMVVVKGPPEGPLVFHDRLFHAFSMPTLLLRREAFDRVGRFDEERRLAEDVDWIMRAQEAGAPIVRVDDVVYHYRQRAGSLTRDLDARNATLVKALRDSIVRRREQAP